MDCGGVVFAVKLGDSERGHPLLVTGDVKGKVCIWDAVSGVLRLQLACTGAVRCVDLCSEGKYLTCGTAVGKCLLWELTGSDPLGKEGPRAEGVDAEGANAEGLDAEGSDAEGAGAEGPYIPYSDRKESGRWSDAGGATSSLPSLLAKLRWQVAVVRCSVLLSDLIFI